MTFVTVVIPNFNHGKYLSRRIESVLSQTYKKFEVIILDDCSTDDSNDIIERYRRNPYIQHVIFNKLNSNSVYIQWHRGISLAKGDYVWIAESDDWASTTFLEKLVLEIETKPNVGIVFSGSHWVDQNDICGNDLSIHQQSFYKNGKNEIKDHLIKYNSIQNASGVLFRTDLAKKYMNKIINYKSCGDWCLYIDILSTSNLVFVEEKLNFFRWYHPSVSKTANKEGLWIKEGVKIIGNSDAYQLRFTREECWELCKYWMNKTNRFPLFQKIHLQFITATWLLIFIGKVFYHSRRSAAI